VIENDTISGKIQADLFLEMHANGLLNHAQLNKNCFTKMTTYNIKAYGKSTREKKPKVHKSK
jgi:hypothetical protein